MFCSCLTNNEHQMNSYPVDIIGNWTFGSRETVLNIPYWPACPKFGLQTKENTDISDMSTINLSIQQYLHLMRLKWQLNLFISRLDFTWFLSTLLTLPHPLNFHQVLICTQKCSVKKLYLIEDCIRTTLHLVRAKVPRLCELALAARCAPGFQDAGSHNLRLHNLK